MKQIKQHRSITKCLYNGPCKGICRAFVAYQLKTRLHIHDFLYDSPRFTQISHGQKNRDGSG